MTQDSTNKAPRRRLLIVGVGFALFYALLIARSYQLQILGDARLERLARSQYTATLEVSPRRGAIYDRNGEVLAMDVMVSSVGVHPAQVTDPSLVLAVLERRTGAKRAELAEKLHSDRKFAWVRRRIPLKDGEAVADAKLDGVQVVTEFRRYYPNKDLAGQLLGAVGYDARALGGLELAYDGHLKAESELNQAERDARGRLFTPADDPDATNDVVLTIDKTIQHLAETALAEGAEKHAVKSGFAIVLDVASGEILALANYPRFNPNRYWSYPQETWKNHAIIDVFEPGSTFKAVLVGAALATGEVGARDKFNCEGGSLQVGRHTVHDHGRYGLMTVQRILQVSSNIGVTRIAQAIGREAFHDFIRTAGFGERTGIGLAGEGAGSVRPPETWKEIELSNMAFGQGLSVTGLQMASAYAAFANGGLLIQPTLVRRIENPESGAVFAEEPEARRRILSLEAAEDLKQMLYTVTQPGGTARSAHVAGYLAGGKTGTAQKVDPKTRTYASGQFVSSFIGFAPLEEPRIVVAVVYDTPRRNGYYGGTAAAPVFRRIAGDSLAALGVSPPSPGKTPRYAAEAKPAHRASWQALTLPEPPAKKSPDLNAARTALEAGKMPDLEGISLRELLELSRAAGANLAVEGSGFVANQSPGSEAKFVPEWRVVMAPAVPPQRTVTIKKSAPKSEKKLARR